MMKPLLIYLKPKDDLPLVDEAIKSIPCEKLILKYLPYPTVYTVALRAIQMNEKFTHIIWVQNDIIFGKKDYDRLVSQFKKLDLQTLGCVMNVSLTEKDRGLLAYTMHNFELTPTGAIPWMQRGYYKGVIRCFHNGSVFMCTREHYLKHPLTGRGKAGYNADYILGKELYDANIPNWIDTDIELKHLRFEGTMQVGKKTPEVEWVKGIED